MLNYLDISKPYLSYFPNTDFKNIGEIILSQIPGISTVSAIAVMKKFGTISNLVDSIRNDPTCLNDIVCETKGKTRKIGKNVVENILKFLVC